MPETVRDCPFKILRAVAHVEGEMSEWLKEHAWKACIRGNADRGFESLSLRSDYRNVVLFSRGTDMNILLVDDKKDILDTMGEILEICHNHKVQGASSGKEALRWIRKKKYDLVVMDLALPVMNGVEVISKIRRLRPKMNIVVLTGITINDTLKEKLKQLDVHKIFLKPKGIHELLHYVKVLKAKNSAA